MVSFSAESCDVLGQFAAVLAEGGPLSEALHGLAAGLPVRNVVVRAADGELLGVGGEALQVMQVVPAHEVSLELPVPGPGGTPLAALSVRGGRPSQLPVLRAAAAVLGLALSAAPAQDLVEDREQELDELADALHDGPMQSLMVARYAVDAALRGSDLEPARAAVQDALVELRQLLGTCVPAASDGLLPALEQLTTKGGAPARARRCPRLRLDVEPAVATLAYRVVQAAAPAQVRVGLQAEGICVEINSGLPSAAALDAACGGPGLPAHRHSRPLHAAPSQGGRLVQHRREDHIVTSVLICDDHRIVREGLRTFVAAVPGVDTVETAASGEEVLARYPHEHPDLILMDVRMPGLGGLETTRRLVAQYPEVKVIMLTAADDRDQVAAAVTSGARGYLLKDVSHEELCAAVAHALDGMDLVEPSLRRALVSPRAAAHRTAAGAAHRARAAGADRHVAGQEQRRHRPRALPVRGHHQDPRPAAVPQARRQRPRPGRRARLPPRATSASPVSGHESRYVGSDPLPER